MFNFANIDIVAMLIRLPVLLLSFTIHEFAHGLSAYLLGDSTAKRDGRLSLNPVRHIDPLGFIMLLVFRFGWAKPVMVNPNYLKNPKGDMAIISFCGPASNFILAFIFIMAYVPSLYLTGQAGHYVQLFLQEGLYLNLALGVFNMLPIPPLDGLKVFSAILPDRIYYRVMDVNGRIGMGIFLILVVTGLLSRIMMPLIQAVWQAYWLLAQKIYFFLPIG
jgi:Zn-dependent protease